VLGAIGLAAAAPASAQIAGKPDWNSPSYVEDARQPYNESRRLAYDNGYREGLKEGQNDARHNDAFNYEDERMWQRADKGYNRSFGDSSRYQQSFRTGFAAGYSEAYQRVLPGRAGGYEPYPSYGNGRVYPNTRGTYGNGPYRDGYPTGNVYPGTRGGYGYNYGPAYSNGVNDGYEKGHEDARDRDSYDPSRHKWYRNGDHDYKSSYGPKIQYESLYRQGFQEGYDRAYRELGYRR